MYNSVPAVHSDIKTVDTLGTYFGIVLTLNRIEIAYQG
jgi:hypothetical protein